jgi:hypothetical protein
MSMKVNVYYVLPWPAHGQVPGTCMIINVDHMHAGKLMHIYIYV